MAQFVACACESKPKAQFLPPSPQSFCIPCGKPYPEPTGENEESRRQRLRPYWDLLERDRKVTFRQHLENHGEIKKIDTLAKFMTETEMEERKMDLEKRSDRLKRMMEEEMFSYTEEMKSDFERRQESRIDEMRQRVKFLKDKRQEEERQFVENKMDQAFQNQCETMRTLLSKKLTREIAKKDWPEQIKLKNRLECEDEENERMYAYLVKVDVDNKLKREQAYDCMRAQAVKEGLEELDRQIMYKRAKAANQSQIEAREKAINAQIQKDIDDAKRKYDEEKTSRFIRAKEHTKDMLATRDYYRDRRIKREEIVAREFLKKAVRELYIEQADRNKAKREMMRSIEIYLQYLKQRDCLSNSREDEFQKIIDGVIEEQYLKVTAARRREQLQRKQLFCSVLAGRGQQIQDMQEQNQKDEMERQKELQFLKDDWKEYLREVEYENRIRAEKKQQYRCDLDCQMQYQNTVKQRQDNEGKRENELCEMEEGFLKKRLETTLQRAQMQASNPYRQLLLGKKIQQCLIPVGSCKK